MTKIRKTLRTRKASYDAFGFTTIELLVSVMIIGLLASGIVLAISGMRNKARSLQNINDVEKIRSALQLYKNDFGMYPTALTPGSPIIGLNNKIYLDRVPNGQVDSSCTEHFSYKSVDNGLNYHLKYCLTTKADKLNKGDCVATDASLCSGVAY